MLYSEEQWEFIGTCPDCNTPLYLMDEKVRWHDCRLETMDDLIDQIQISTAKIKKIEAKVKTKTVAQIIREFNAPK